MSTRLCLVIAPFYEDIAAMLRQGAQEAARVRGCETTVVEVPGAFEIPAAILAAMRSGKFDGYVALGCVIRGETTHYDYVCEQSAHGLMQLSLEHGAAIGYGILTCETHAQAVERADPLHGNKGKFAVEAALRMIEIQQEMRAS